ncbi:hypothetical protein BaRGS_00027178, partial [Batillaria attramentaria]
AFVRPAVVVTAILPLLRPLAGLEPDAARTTGAPCAVSINSHQWRVGVWGNVTKAGLTINKAKAGKKNKKSTTPPPRPHTHLLQQENEQNLVTTKKSPWGMQHARSHF